MRLPWFRRWIFSGASLLGVLLLNVVETSGTESRKSACEGRFEGRKIDPKMLSAILADHNIWLQSRGKDDAERRMDLCEAHLEGANLTEAHLEGATLSKVNLQDADLSKAYLANASFDIKSKALPEISVLASADGLKQLTFTTSPLGLTELREALKKAGMREQARQITYAIEKRQTEKKRDSNDKEYNWLEGTGRYFAFELTCDYGMSPGWALRILWRSIAIFAVLYMLVLIIATTGRPGIWAVWAADRPNLREGEKVPTRITHEFFCPNLSEGDSALLHFFPKLQEKVEGTIWRRRLLICLLYPSFGLYFSLLSAFNIGWHDLNIGTWISRIQPREYTLRATGWVRTVSGLQSLLSVYLLALWVLTYFGNPFE